LALPAWLQLDLSLLERARTLVSVLGAPVSVCIVVIVVTRRVVEPGGLNKGVSKLKVFIVVVVVVIVNLNDLLQVSLPWFPLEAARTTLELALELFILELALELVTLELVTLELVLDLLTLKLKKP
jgi:hypothetical protein